MNKNDYSKNPCNDLVDNFRATQKQKNFQIVSRLVYCSALIIYILLQSFWLHLMNSYNYVEPKNLKQKFAYKFGSIHIIALNMIIYLKITLDEAQHSWKDTDAALKVYDDQNFANLLLTVENNGQVEIQDKKTNWKKFAKISKFSKNFQNFKNFEMIKN